MEFADPIIRGTGRVFVAPVEAPDEWEEIGQVIDWTRIIDSDPVEDIKQYAKWCEDQLGEPVVVSPWQERLISVFFEDDIEEEDDQKWDISDFKITRRVIVPADLFAFASRRVRSLSRRQSADHLGGRPRVRCGRLRRVRGDCEEA